MDAINGKHRDTTKDCPSEVPVRLGVVLSNSEVNMNLMVKTSERQLNVHLLLKIKKHR